MKKKKAPSNNFIVNFVSFADINSIKTYFILLNSIKLLYKNFEVKIFLGIDSLVNEKYGDILKKNGVYIKNLDEDEVYKSTLFPKLHDYISVFTFGRLFIYKLFPELLDKSCIYLDTDIILIEKIDNSLLNKKKNFGFTEFVEINDRG